MNLVIPPLPPILVGTSLELWNKWYAFYLLPLSIKADIVDAYPDLIIEVPPGPTDKAAGVQSRVYFNPGTLDARVPREVVFKPWRRIVYADKYPLQSCPDLDVVVDLSTDQEKKEFLYDKLDSMNYAVLAYKYRYLVRPEMFYFMVDYNKALLDATTQDELLTFYDLKRPNLTRQN